MSSKTNGPRVVHTTDNFIGRNRNALPIAVVFETFTIVVAYNDHPNPEPYELVTWIEDHGVTLMPPAWHTLTGSDHIESGVKESATLAVQSALAVHLLNILKNEGTEGLNAELREEEDTPVWVVTACVEALQNYEKCLERDIAAQTPELYESKRLQHLSALTALSVSGKELSASLQKDLRSRQR